MKKLKFISVKKFTLQTMFAMDKPYMLLLVLSMITSSIIPFINANLVSEIVNLAMSEACREELFGVIVIMVAALVVIQSLDPFILWYRSNHYISLGHKFDVLVARKTLNMRYEYTESPELEELRMKAIKACSSIPVSAEKCIELGANVIKLLGCATVFTMFNPWIVVIVLIFSTVNYRASKFFQNRCYENEKKGHPYRRKINYFLDTMLDYVAGKEIRAFSAAELFKGKYEEAETEAYVINRDTLRNKFFDRIISVLIVGIQFAFIYLVAGKAYFDGTAQIGDAILYVNLLLVFSGAYQGIFNKIIDINVMGDRMKSMQEYMGLDDDDLSAETEEIDTDNVTIEFDHVWYKYPNQDDYILKDVCVVFDNRKKYAIVGENGSGKTTMIKLLMRLYLPTKGCIYINGKDYRTIKRENYYKLFSTVFQDFNILAFTLRENIILSERKEEDSVLQSVLERQGLGSRVASLKDGADTYVTQEYIPGGVDFSGGEKQKIAIARADYRQSPVVVMDEPTSALDPIAEKNLYDNMENMFENRLLLMISHRLQSVSICDYIYFLKKGEITERGTHDALMEKGGDYNTMYRVQAKWYE